MASACVRLVRADYGGDGRTRTRTGVEIEVVSRLDPKEEPGKPLAERLPYTPNGYVSGTPWACSSPSGVTARVSSNHKYRSNCRGRVASK